MQISIFCFFLFLLQSLLSVHDAVAQRDFEPTLPPIPDDILEEDEDSVKIVSLVKTKEPLVSKYVSCFKDQVKYDIYLLSGLKEGFDILENTLISCQELDEKINYI